MQNQSKGQRETHIYCDWRLIDWISFLRLSLLALGGAPLLERWRPFEVAAPHP